MSTVTAIIPVGPGHDTLAHRAVASVNAQTHPTACVVVHDADGRGPGWARNTGLSQVEADFVVFLDADDVIAPTFVARCLSVWQPHRYVYTDWYEGERYTHAPDVPWSNGTWHVVTTLLPSNAVYATGGFDEDLPGGEDTDFYLKLHANGVRGIALHEALFTYTKDGTRAHAFVHGADLSRVQQLFTERYGGHMTSPAPIVMRGHPDGVEAVALWRGNRRERGRATGYLYPRSGNGQRLRVHPDDIAATPHLFQQITTGPVPAWVPRENTGFQQVVDAFASGMGYRRTHPSAQPSKLAAAGEVKPDVTRLLQLYRQAVL